MNKHLSSDSNLSRSDLVITSLRKQIITGVYKPGERLTEGQLATNYGVSRVPVREAIRTLKAEGFLRVVPYWGTVVAQLSSREISDLLDVRSSLELLGVEQAAKYRTEEDLLGLKELIKQGNDALGKKDMNALPELNTRFHLLITKASGNVALLEVMGTLSAKIEWAYSKSVSVRAGASWTEHKAILAAIARGDSQAAREVLERHIFGARKAIS